MNADFKNVNEKLQKTLSSKASNAKQTNRTEDWNPRRRKNDLFLFTPHSMSHSSINNFSAT